MSSQGVRDASERLLALAISGLPPRRLEWGQAMRAELAAIDDESSRRRFARSAAVAVFLRGYGVVIGFVGGATLASAIACVASVAMSSTGSPGLLAVSVPVPAAILCVTTFWASAEGRSWARGALTGAIALVTTFVAVVAVVAVEGIGRMNRHGVFILDGDPPKGAVGAFDVVFDIFTTGMWVGHVAIWSISMLVGSAIGFRAGVWFDRARADRTLASR